MYHAPCKDMLLFNCTAALLMADLICNGMMKATRDGIGKALMTLCDPTYVHDRKVQHKQVE